MWQLIQTQPKSSRRDIRIARPWSSVHTLDARPYSTPFAQLERLVLVVELLHGDDRAEDLVLDHLVVLPQPVDDGRLEEVPAVALALAAGDDLAWSGARSRNR